jgi:hypothetical protein
MSRVSFIAVSLATGVGCFAKTEPIDESSTGSGTAATVDSDGSTASGGDGDDALVPIDDLDDGAIYPAGDGYEAHWYPSGEENVEGRQYLGQFPAGRQYYGYMRFQLPTALTAGSTIDSATLELFGHDDYLWDGAYALRVWLQESADAPKVGGISDYPTDGGSIAFVSSSVRWPEAGGLAWQQPGPNATPDLAVMLQALVDAQGGLEAGAHLQLWVGSDALDGSGEEVGWLDSAAGAATAPRLTIVAQP